MHYTDPIYVLVVRVACNLVAGCHRMSKTADQRLHTGSVALGCCSTLPSALDQVSSGPTPIFRPAAWCTGAHAQVSPRSCSSLRHLTVAGCHRMSKTAHQRLHTGSVVLGCCSTLPSTLDQVSSRQTTAFDPIAQPPIVCGWCAYICT